jgi:hypothetical protein
LGSGLDEDFELQNGFSRGPATGEVESINATRIYLSKSGVLVKAVFFTAPKFF